MSLSPLTDARRTALAKLVPPDTIGDVPPAYREEPRGRYHGTATALARPRSTEEVAAILRFASAERVGVVPYGGGTGLVGGQTPLDADGTLLVSLERMNAIREVNTEDNVLIAEAGAILADIQAVAEAEGRLFPLALAAQGTARIGGNLATNAGGVQVLRYGNTRDLCLGLEAVLADGTVIGGLKRLRKDNTGYDLRHLMIGSEGTLGIITAASLKLFPRPGEVATGFSVVPDPGCAVRLLRALQDALGDTVTAFELIDGTGLSFLEETGLPPRAPFADIPAWSVLIEAGGPAGAGVAERTEAALAEAFEAGLVEDAVIAQNAGQAARFWELRETIPEANRRVGAIVSHDISVPVSRLAEFITRTTAAIAALDSEWRINCFGHIGDGNLHFNVFPPKGRARSDYSASAGAIRETVHELAVSLGGSFSAEHGIGRMKVSDLERFGDPGARSAMARIKAALDPEGILNPGAMLG